MRQDVDDRVIVISAEDVKLVNALQRCAAVVLQKSTREGFGLTVTEAMWKGAAVIGGNVGGSRRQIKDGENGFLVDVTSGASAWRVDRAVKWKWSSGGGAAKRALFSGPPDTFQLRTRRGGSRRGARDARKSWFGGFCAGGHAVRWPGGCVRASRSSSRSASCHTGRL
jgi:hypothetical protein